MRSSLQSPAFTLAQNNSENSGNKGHNRKAIGINKTVEAELEGELVGRRVARFGSTLQQQSNAHANEAYTKECDRWRPRASPSLRLLTSRWASHNSPKH